MVELAEPGIRVRLQDARIGGEVPLRVFAPPVGRVVEHRRGRRGATERPVVAHIGPQSSGARLAFGQHRHRGVVAVQPLCRQHVSLDQRHQWRQRRRAGADPVRQGRGIELNALPSERLALAMER